MTITCPQCGSDEEPRDKPGTWFECGTFLTNSSKFIPENAAPACVTIAELRKKVDELQEENELMRPIYEQLLAIRRYAAGPRKQPEDEAKDSG